MKSAFLVDWVHVNAAWLGYVVMALLGGAIAHIQEFEKAQMEWYWGAHVGKLCVAWTKASFIAVIVYNLGQEYWKLPPPVCFVITGVASVFASDSIRWVYDRGRSLLSAKLPGKDKE